MCCFLVYGLNKNAFWWQANEREKCQYILEFKEQLLAKQLRDSVYVKICLRALKCDATLSVTNLLIEWMETNPEPDLFCYFSP